MNSVSIYHYSIFQTSSNHTVLSHHKASLPYMLLSFRIDWMMSSKPIYIRI